MQSINWFELWIEDKNCVLDCMRRNMKSDIEAGYDINGKSILYQRFMIKDYEDRFDYEMRNLREMDEKKANHWCYVDLKRRGAI